MSAHVRERLSAYLDGEVGLVERSAVDAHLAQCPACAARLEELALVDSAVAGLAVPGTKDDDAFAARVRARIEAEAVPGPHARPGASKRPPAWAWAVAAALLVAVVTPLTLRELRPFREQPALDAARPTDAQAPGRAGTGNGLSREAGATPKSLSFAEGKVAVAPVAAPSASGSATMARTPRDQAVPTPAEATPRRAPLAPELETRGREEARAAPGAPAPAPRAGAVQLVGGEVAAQTAAEGGVVAGVAGGVVGGIADTTTTHASVPEKTTSDREVPEKQERAEPGRRLAEESQRRAKSAPASGAFAGPPAPAGETPAFARLAAERPTTAEEWRRLREAWRELAHAHPGRPLGDEALVRAIEAAAGAYRASADAKDARVLERDVAEYLGRQEAPQGERVRRLLREATR